MKRHLPFILFHMPMEKQNVAAHIFLEKETKADCIKKEFSFHGPPRPNSVRLEPTKILDHRLQSWIMTSQPLTL
jgi:hypothetical protein